MGRGVDRAAHLGIRLIGVFLAAFALYLSFQRVRRHRLTRVFRQARSSSDDLKAQVENGGRVSTLDVRATEGGEVSSLRAPGRALDHLQANWRSDSERSLMTRSLCCRFSRLHILAEREPFAHPRQETPPPNGGMLVCPSRDFAYLLPRPPGGHQQTDRTPFFNQDMTARSRRQR